MSTQHTNLELTKKFDAVYPGPHSNLKVSMQVGDERIFVARGNGGRVWDVEGKEYVDFVGGGGPNIFGHRHPEFLAALQEHMDCVPLTVGTGMLFTSVDIELAEKIESYIPCAEKVKFCVTGTEAIQVAIRLARAYTGRRYFIRFERHYHGWMDNVLGGVGDQALFRRIREGKAVAHRPLPVSSPDDFVASEGRDPSGMEQCFMLPWNDIEVLEQVLQAYGKEVAMIQCEAIPANNGCMPPLPGFLERVRDLCNQYGIVLNFDEIITGFRVGLGGIQKELGVTPDIAVLGKAMAGGIPCSAVVGKNEIMDLIRQRRVISPGTYMGYPLGLAATLATIRILEKGNGAVYREFDRLQGKFTAGLRSIAKSRGLHLLTQGCRGVFYTFFTNKEVDVIHKDAEMANVDMPRVMKFWTEIAKEGVLAAPYARWYLCTAHTDADIEWALDAAERAIRKI